MSEKKEEKQREKYTVEVEPMEFTADAQCMTLTSSDLCKLVNTLFKAAFADFDGSKFEMNGNIPTITLAFRHIKHDDEAGYYACEMASGKKSGSTVIDRSRTYDRLIKEGDRYYLTDDGKDVLKELLIPRFASRPNLNWGEVVADFVDSSGSYFNYNKETKTKVMYVDPNALCAKIFGDKGYSYSVQVRGDLFANRPQGWMGNNYVLNILRVDNAEIQNTYAKLGIGVMSSDFIKA